MKENIELSLLNTFLTGISVPVSALRSKYSCGIGEFYDLEILGKWCKHIGITLIQILPVNDTGFQSSPYSALSAFALHPIYIRLQVIPEFTKVKIFKDDLNSIKENFESAKYVDFENLLKAKLDLLSKIYLYTREEIQTNKEISQWISKNLWIKAYSVFKVLKQQNHNRHWKEWLEINNPDVNSIDSFWNTNISECYFYVWVQYRLEEQLKESKKRLQENGILLKGDIPILINEDSVDLWVNRQYFNTLVNAGAPPDLFSAHGQNWGFPIYNWKALEKEDYKWWKDRLLQAAKFYHAYRIDHVLGFFRIWQIPANDVTGILGYFNPYDYISNEELKEIGFDIGRVRWMSFPHIHECEIPSTNKYPANYIKQKYLSKIGNEDLYNLNERITGERSIIDLDEVKEIKEFLLFWYRNRTLLNVNKDNYYPSWNFSETKAFKSLNFEEKNALRKLFIMKEEKSEKVWSVTGKKLLSMMQKTTEMLMCAEDLGVVPACVPNVLKDLNILSLKIERWTKNYSKPDTPYIPVQDYPRLSVCTPSVHDTTTIRGWWDEELSEKAKKEYFTLLETDFNLPYTYSIELAKEIIKRNLDANSILTIFQIQDILFLNEEINRNCFIGDRINVPGTVTKVNWTYRVPKTIEELIDNTKFNETLLNLIEKRKQRKC